MQSPIPVSPVIDPGSARLQKLTGGDHRGMANDGDEAALAPGFDDPTGYKFAARDIRAQWRAPLGS